MAILKNNLVAIYTIEELANNLGVSIRKIERMNLPTIFESRKDKKGVLRKMRTYSQDTMEDAARELGLKSVKSGKNEKIIDRDSAVTEINQVLENLKKTLKEDLLFVIKKCSPAFFERLVVELLFAMGYGGTLQDAGKAVGKSGDGGIDGIIKEDRLGLDVIYLQAKRWEGNVSRPEIQKFAGALLGNQARKGVFITTSDFTKEAKDYVKTISSNIILINGEELAELMIDYNVGVSVATTYEIKKMDSDYFSEE